MSATPASHPVATAALFGLWGLFWVTMTVVEMQDALLNPYIDWWEPVLWEGSSAIVATLWLLAQRRVDPHYQQYLERPWIWFLHHLKWFPLIAVTFIVAVYAMRHGVYELAGKPYRHEPWPDLFVYESVKLVLFGSLWLGIIFGFNSFALWRSQREQLLQIQKSLAETQLLHLQSQLRPHFLFNALNTVSSLMHSDPARADRMLVRLGDLLRASLQVERRELSPMQEELQLLELYAQIMQERFVGRVNLSWDIDARTLRAAIPPLLLQPLLENAFKHGVEKSQHPVEVQVVSRRDGDELMFAVHNTGELAAQRGEGIGLRNCQQRLRLLYGDGAAVTLTAEPPDVVVQVRIPWREYQP